LSAGGSAFGCGTVSTLRAKDAMGREWVVRSSCLPDGWTQTADRADVKTCAACQSLSLAACAATSYCQVAQARKIDGQRTCLLPEQDVSCVPTTEAPASVRRRVVDPDGDEWITSGSFIPAGWHDSTSRNTTLGDCPATDGGGDATAADCSSLSVAACAATAGCGVVEAQEIRGACLLPKRAVGCLTIGMACGELLTRAKDPGGKEWRFSTTCIPAGWTNAPGNTSLPECSATGG
jgi:hypothetical protein